MLRRVSLLQASAPYIPANASLGCFWGGGVDWRFKKMVFDREKEARRDRFLQPEEATALEACLRHPHLMLAYLIATDTGLRKTATLSLNVDDIDWKEQAIRKIGKGGKEAWVPMTERLAGALQE